MAGDIFVGREPELEQFLDKATAAKTQIVFIAGEAGASKSALVTEFVRRAENVDPKLVAAIGECNAQTGAGHAYLPFRQVLTALSGAQGEQETVNAVNATNAARVWGRALMKASASAWSAAEAHLAAGLQAFDAGHAWLEAARTHVAWGQGLQGRGNPQAAREHFEKATAQFQASELTSELEQTKELIHSL